MKTMLLLMEYNMLTNSFPTIGLAYKHLLTLPVTQVTCERSFSVLKIIKSWIRSTLSQDHLEALMLMKCEYDIVDSIDNNDVINQVAKHSTAYGKLLNYVNTGLCDSLCIIFALYSGSTVFSQKRMIKMSIRFFSEFKTIETNLYYVL